MQTVVKDNSIERREKRAKSIAAMGLVNRIGDKFQVSTPSLRGKQSLYEVRRNETGKICCNCLEFEESSLSEETFRCEHILAVKFSLLAKNTEVATKTPDTKNVSPEKSPRSVYTQSATESDAEKTVVQTKVKDKSFSKSSSGEQKSATNLEIVSAAGPAEAVDSRKSPLANNGDKIMNQETIKNMPFVTAEEAAAINAGNPENPNNVMNFPNTLRQLRQNVDPNLVKTREGWRDRNGNTHYVDYVEWHTVADILDQHAPNWAHTVKDIRQIGEIVTVTVAITVDGITREGLGTGVADSELGIKKAEHDALKRAAVKFGIARDLYKKESEVIERDGAVPPNNDGGFPANPVAKTLMDLVTAKQLGMIRALAREKGIEADEECSQVMQCKTDELSKKAASAFIQHLQDYQAQKDSVQTPLRRVS